MRFLLALLVALAINLALFWLLQHMLQEKDILVERETSAELVSFIRLSDEPEPPQRQQPERVEEKLEPPPVNPVNPARQVIMDHQVIPKWQMPEMDLPLDIGSGPYLGFKPELPTTMAVEPVPKMRFPPRYPQRALVRGVEGRVVLKFTINQDGSVSDATVIESEPAGYFEQAALRAIRRWQFHPKVIDGKAVARSATQTIKFNLKK
ncbi:MAG: energy transducer TonB [Candidatus Thiodiazotropha sp.]|jgi:periplasmic protein TonB